MQGTANGDNGRSGCGRTARNLAKNVNETFRLIHRDSIFENENKDSF